MKTSLLNELCVIQGNLFFWGAILDNLIKSKAKSREIFLA